MLDITKYDENDWDWWEDTVEWWSTSKGAYYCFRANIAEFTPDMRVQELQEVEIKVKG